MNKLCDSIETLSMAYLDDELADEELREFELHKLECSACRDHVEQERAALDELRRQLAAPAAPDVVRARIGAMLDREDAQASREERRASVAGWLLPGFASVAAVAALVLFAFGRAPATPPSVAVEAVRAQVRAPQVQFQVPMRPVVALSPDAPPTISVHRVAEWQTELRGRQVQTQLFQVQGAGIEATVQASQFDATGWDLQVGELVRAGALEMWFVTDGSHWALVHQGSDGTGYMFSSAELAPRDLAQLVAQQNFLLLLGR